MIGMDPQTGKPLRKYWGYDPVAFFAPKASYASVREPGAAVLEFKDMVRALMSRDPKPEFHGMDD